MPSMVPNSVWCGKGGGRFVSSFPNARAQAGSLIKGRGKRACPGLHFRYDFNPLPLHPVPPLHSEDCGLLRVAVTAPRFLSKVLTVQSPQNALGKECTESGLKRVLL